MGFPYRIRLSGEMGHNLVLMGKIIGEAAVVYEGYYAIQCQSYGQETRGEANCADIIIDKEKISCPGFKNPNVLLCLTQTACDKYILQLDRQGVLIMDSKSVIDLPEKHARVYGFPIFQVAQDQFKSESSACLVALGVMAGFLQKISMASLLKSLGNQDIGDLNHIKEEAVQIGYGLGRRKLSHKSGVS